MNDDKAVTVAVDIQKPGRVKKFKPEDKNVSSSAITTGLYDDWPKEVDLVEPSHPNIVKKANVDPFTTGEYDWKERQETMLQLMHDKMGVGLAANQIGSRYNMFVMNHSHLGDIGVFRPKIVEYGEEETQIEEGCLTWPLLFLRINRASSIKVSYTKADGETTVEMMMDGMDARCFLHEYDHLQGINFLDLAGTLQLKRAKEKRDKYLRKIGRRLKRL